MGNGVHPKEKVFENRLFFKNTRLKRMKKMLFPAFPGADKKS